MNILIVEDEVIAANYLKEMISNAGYRVVGTVGTGKGAIELARTRKPDLILMDIMLKDAISGVDAAVEIRFHNRECCIVFLTSYSDEEMIETAIEASACGYFLKPYNQEEILANLKILEARIADKKKQPLPPEANMLMLANDYRYCYTNQQLYHKSTEVFLSKREHQILDYFCQNAKRVIDSEAIIHHIWGTAKPRQTLRSLIHRIREKTCQEIIVNINRSGYKIGLRG